jgi:subfamily B ATP-binding cassette protein MsbA
MRLGAQRLGPPSSERHGARGGASAGVDQPRKPVSLATAWQHARSLVWARRGRLLAGFALMLVNRASGLVLPATSKFLVDDVIGKRQVELLIPLAAAAGAAALVQAITSFALSQVLGVAAQRAITEMRRKVQRHVSHLSVQYFDRTQSGILISRIMSDAEGIRNLVGTGLVQLAGGIVTAIAALGVLLYLNWRLTLITLGALALFGVAMALAFMRLRPVFRERGKINAEVTGRLSQSLGGIRVVKAYNAEQREQRVFTHGVHRLFRNIARSITGVSAVSAVSTVIVGIIGVVMIVVGGRSILDGTMTLGDFVMYIFFTGLLAAPIVQMASIGTQITEAFAGLDRINELLSEPAEDAGLPTSGSLEDVRGELAFEHVTFGYDPTRPVLRDVSLHAPAGTTTALVGPSGSGKSTLIGLIMAFHRPQQGRILVDGRDLATIPLGEYRRRLGVVLQDNFLFDGTVAENIRYSRPDATFEEVLAAARVAHCDEFVDQFPDKYDTVVGERGVRLSGGQRQRVAIARAILADPRLLILDEATSSLDSESEALIQDGLRRLREGRTTFVIAHRLSTIRSADQILVLDGGVIVERGTHDTLLALNGRYRQLHDKQYGWERERFVNPGEEWDADDVDAPRPAATGRAPGPAGFFDRL